MGNKERRKIIKQEAKYFSLILDSTPDISYTDQTSQIIWYVTINGEKVHGVLLISLKWTRKTFDEISNIIFKKLENDGINI